VCHNPADGVQSRSGASSKFNVVPLESVCKSEKRKPAADVTRHTAKETTVVEIDLRVPFAGLISRSITLIVWGKRKSWLLFRRDSDSEFKYKVPKSEKAVKRDKRHRTSRQVTIEI
jgi:hypothetical protein